MATTGGGGGGGGGGLQIDLKLDGEASWGQRVGGGAAELQIDLKLDGEASWGQRVRIAKIALFGYPRWPPFFKWHLLPNRVSWIDPKLDGKHRSDTEIQNC